MTGRRQDRAEPRAEEARGAASATAAGAAQEGRARPAGDGDAAIGRSARAEDPRNLVQALAKGLRVLESFTAERPEMTLSEVAAGAGLDPGTTFRMLNTLVRLGYLARVPDSRRFRLTLKVTDLGFHAIGRRELREIARPILRSLVDEVNEAASLGVLEGADILYIERVRAGVTRLGVDIRLGTTIPAACSIIGHAVLAHLPEAEVERVLATAPRSGAMPALELPREEIRRSLAEIRRTGHALRDAYFGNGLRILAVPVIDLDRHPVGAVSVAAPAFRTSREAFAARALGPVRAAAADIGRALQASGSIALSR